MSDQLAKRQLHKGANVALRELDAELGAVTVLLESRGAGNHAVEADVSVLPLAADGRVRSSDDLVFYNQPIGLGGAVHLRDRMRLEDAADGADATADVVTLNLDDVPEEVERLVVAASLDPGAGVTFEQMSIGLRLQRTSDAADLLGFDISDATTETALVVAEFYRRNGEWRVRAVGQGYADGFAALVTDFGVDVADEATDSEAVEAILDETPVEPPAAEVGPALTPPAVSVRRPARAPRYPKDWDKSIPAEDGNDWQQARLFPVAGIGGGEEQERRATSALLAVMTGVREFGRTLAKKCGAPGGTLTTYIEVPFGQDEEAYRPDGVLTVKRGQTEWTALIEVKTANNPHKVEQIDHYVDIARTRGYDAVITISNELTGPDLDHPVSIDRRKLKKIGLVHLSWDQIRTEALLALHHRGVADTTQQWILREYLRYMNHARSGTSGFTDMGRHWVTVREGVKAKTARSSDKPVADISARFDQLMQHISLQLTGMLGVDVRALTPRDAPDTATRCQQLADSGVLFGSLRVPGTVDLLVVNADIRTDRVGARTTIQAPRGEPAHSLASTGSCANSRKKHRSSCASRHCSPAGGVRPRWGSPASCEPIRPRCCRRISVRSGRSG